MKVWELLVLSAVVMVICGIAWVVDGVYFVGYRQQNAISMARDHVRVHLPAWRNVRYSCQGDDNDRNGYVTCSLSREGSDAVVPLECPECTTNTFCFSRVCRPARQTWGAAE